MASPGLSGDDCAQNNYMHCIVFVICVVGNSKVCKKRRAVVCNYTLSTPNSCAWASISRNMLFMLKKNLVQLLNPWKRSVFMQFMTEMKYFELAACNSWPTFSRSGLVSVQAPPWPLSAAEALPPCQELSGGNCIPITSQKAGLWKNSLFFIDIYTTALINPHTHPLTHTSARGLVNRMYPI